METLNTQTQQPTQNSNSVVIYMLIFVILLLLGYIGYIYSTKEIVQKEHINKNYIQKENVTFDMLPIYIQDKYVLKSLYDYKINELETKNLSALKKLQESVVKKDPNIMKKIIATENTTHTRMDTSVVLIPKEQNIDTTTVSNVNKIKTNEKTQTYTCKTLRSSSEYISAKCKKELISFLEKNKDAKRFEVIGLIDNQEFKLIEKLEDVYGTKRLGNLSKYAQTGLARHRVVEASWVIRQQLGKTVQIDTVNYAITKKHKRGFVVKAYK